MSNKWKIPVLILLTAAWSRFMAFQISPLTSSDIVAYELAKNQTSAIAIQNEWARNDLIGEFKMSVYLDYVFIVIYGLCLYVLSTTISNVVFKTRSGIVVLVTSMAVFVACLCDAFENMVMLLAISFEPNSTLVLATFWLAVIKFSLVAAVLFYSIIGFVAYLIVVIRKRANEQ